MKQLKQLQQKKFRIERNETLVSGVKIVTELLQECPGNVLSVCTTQTYYEDNKELLEEFAERIFISSEAHLSQMSPVVQLNSILAQVSIPHKTFQLPKEGKWILLDNISDPGNLGTIIRIADWFGWDGVICSSNSVEAYNPKTIQASMGSVFRIPVYYQPLNEVLAQLVENSFDVFAADMVGENYSTVKPNHKSTALLMGSESHGITFDLPKGAKKVTIPRVGKAESLNVSVAAGILVAAFS